MATSNEKTMKERLFEMAVHNILSNVINVGNRLGLFKALAKIATAENPVLPKQLAEAAGCKERYVREWCSSLACGRVIEVNAEEKFWIAPENVEALTVEGVELVTHGMMPALIGPLDQLVECFKKDGPLGLDYSQFEAFQEFMGKFSYSLHEKHVFVDMVPAIGHGMEEKLTKGGLKVLDVGCGNGFHSSLFAERYPKSQFTGLDIGADAIEAAKKRCHSDGSKFTNLEFVQCDASAMNPSWTEKFDLVLIFDACHDQMRPDLCIREIYRVLKSDSIFAMLEIFGSSNAYEDRNSLGGGAAMMYGCSMFHCLPVGSNRPDALCMGAMWGCKRATNLIKDCGFKEVEAKDTPYFPINRLYLSKK